MASLTDKQIKLQNSFFCHALAEMLDALKIRYGSHPKIMEGITASEGMVNLLKVQSDSIIQRAIGEWKDGTAGTWMKNKQVQPLLAQAKVKPDTPILGQLNFEYMLAHPETKDAHEALWSRLQNITAIASEPHTYPGIGASHPQTPQAFLGTLTSAGIPSAPAPAPPTQNPPKMDAGKMVATVKEHLPEAMKAFKELMSNQGDDNPVKSIVNMLKNPKEVGSDLTSNLVGLAGDMGMEPSIFEETESSPFEARFEELAQDVKNITETLANLTQEINRMSRKVDKIPTQ